MDVGYVCRSLFGRVETKSLDFSFFQMEMCERSGRWMLDMFADLSHSLLCLKSLVRTTLDIEISSTCEKQILGEHILVDIDIRQYQY